MLELGHKCPQLRSIKMTTYKLRSLLVVATVGILVAVSQFHHQAYATDESDSTQAKIDRAMSAGPENISRSARIVDPDSNGNTIVLREGNNGFTCMPGNLKVVGQPPMCVDAVSLQWFADAKAHRPKPTTTVPGDHLHSGGRHAAQRFRPNDTT